MILERLRSGGVEHRLRDNQFDFRPGRGADLAILTVQRMMDAAQDLRDGEMSVLLLDWSKAFDRIDPGAMQVALRRFGLPEPYIDMVTAVYRCRSFTVRDAGRESTAHSQAAGIAQGCPLSPYLFIIVLTVILADVDWEKDGFKTDDVEYADDTALMSASSACLQAALDSLLARAAPYGLLPNWDKTVVLRIGNPAPIHDPSGRPIPSTEQHVYLGGLLTTTGSARCAVSRRLGEARGTFTLLSAVWSHSSLSRARKQRVYEACVVSKLLYSLETER